MHVVCGNFFLVSMTRFFRVSSQYFVAPVIFVVVNVDKTKQKIPFPYLIHKQKKLPHCHYHHLGKKPYCH